MALWTPPSQHLFRFDAFEVDLRTGELRKHGTKLKIQEQPLRVLAMLLAQPGELVTREQLHKGLWSDDTFVDFERGLNTAVNRLRAALNDSAESPRFIETVGRRGYRFIAPVTSDGSGKIETSHKRPGSGGGVFDWRSDVRARTSSEPSGLDLPIALPRFRTNTRKWNRAMPILTAILIAAGATGYIMHRWGAATTRAPNFQGIRFTKLTSNGKAEDVAISPDGAYVVYSQRDRYGVGLWLYQVAIGGKTQILQSEDVDFRGLTFSPDGNSIYFVRSRKEVGAYKDLYAMPVLGGNARLLVEDIDSPISFSPDGRQFAYCQGTGPPYATRIRIANADGAENRVLTTITGVQSNITTGPAWSPDGRTLAVSQMLRGDRSGYVLDAVSVADGMIWEVYWHPAAIGRPLWLPDSQTILADLDDSTGAGQLWTISLHRGKERRVTNDLANWGTAIDATHDAQTVSAIQWSVVANIWSAPVTNLSKIRQITTGELPMVAAVARPDGKILAVSGNDDLWLINGDGTGLAPFSSLREVAPPVVCRDSVVTTSYSTSAGRDQQAGPDTVKATKLGSGRVIVHRSYQLGPVDLMRVDQNGLNPTKLASGFLYSPTCSPDGKFVYYVLMGTQQQILRVPIQGGRSEIVRDVPGQTIRGRMSVSPDGRFLALPYDEGPPKPVSRLAVISTQGQLVRTFDAPGGIYREGCLHWSLDGKSLQYLLTKGDVTNLWEQPLTKTSARQISSFTSGRIFDFNWTADGKQLLLARGEVTGNVVLVTNLR